MTDALMPCPFCGSDPITDMYTVMRPDGPDERFEVECRACEQAGAIGHPTIEAAIAAWNRRADSPEIAALTARVAELEAALQPFAAIALLRDGKAGHPDMIDAPGLAITPTQVRRARAALKQEQPE